jgi:hypothetical protein
MTSAALPSAPSSLDAPGPLTTYRGCCHCQSTIFRVTLPSISSNSAANLRCACAPCAKRGALWARAPPGALVFERGRDALRAYPADDPETGTEGGTQYVRVRRVGVCVHVLSGNWAVLRDVRDARPRLAVRGGPRSARKRPSSTHTRSPRRLFMLTLRLFRSARSATSTSARYRRRSALCTPPRPRRCLRWPTPSCPPRTRPCTAARARAARSVSRC